MVVVLTIQDVLYPIGKRFESDIGRYRNEVTQIDERFPFRLLLLEEEESLLRYVLK